MDTKNLVLYARVSTERQFSKDLSIPDQLRQMRNYCELNGYGIAAEYVEEGRTATNDHRPVLQQMINRVMTGDEGICGILVHSFSRLFRNVTDMAIYLKKLKKKGVRLISVTQDVDDSPMGRFVTFFYGLADEMYSAINSTNVKRTRRENARRGFFNGAIPPFGYKIEQTKTIGHTGNRRVLVLNDDEAMVVKEIYNLYEGVGVEEPMGMKKLVTHLNTYSLYRGVKWRIQIVQKILSDPVYTGVYEFGGRSAQHKAPLIVEPRRETTSHTTDDEGPIAVPVPAIIDKDRFLRMAVRRLARSPKKTPPLHVTPRALLTGLCRCGQCNSSMQIVTGKSGRYRYLKCNRRHTMSNKGCTSPNIPYEKFESLVLKTIIHCVLTENRLKLILKDCRRNVDQLSGSQRIEQTQLVAHQRAIERKLDNLYKLIEDSKIRIDDHLKGRLQGWQDELAQVHVRLNNLKVEVIFPKNLPRQIDLADFRAAMVAILANPESPEAIRFMHLVVEEIRIYPDEATISGSNLGVVEASLTQKRGSLTTVPSFVHNWRRGGDSNPR